MAMGAEDTVRDVLEGGPGAFCGITYVPEPAITRALGVKDEPYLVAAAEWFELNFAFVDAEREDAEVLCAGLSARGVAACWSTSGPLGRVALRRGWEATLTDSVRDARSLDSALNETTAAVCEQVDSAVEAGATAFVVAEDLAGADGMLVSPDWVIDELAPHLAQAASYATDRGLVPLLHSDGEVRAALRTIARAGFAGVHLGGMGWTAFEHMYDAARGEGLAVIGGLEGEELRAGDASAASLGSRAASLAERRGLLVADDGGLTTPEEVAALGTAFAAVHERGFSSGGTHVAGE
jgi:hypothetical protein